jgi:phage-related protein
MPYSKALGKGLFELRIVGTINVRFIYTFYDNKIWILHGFIKKTNKIPKQDISYAHKQLKTLLH